MISNTLFVVLLSLALILQFVESDDGISLFPGFPITSLSSKNEACKKDSELYVSELKQTTMWAAKSKYSEIYRYNTYSLFQNCKTKNL